MGDVLHVLENRLDAELCGPDLSGNRLADILIAIGSRRQLKTCLKHVLGDSLACASLCERASVHPNGYDKISLIDRRPQYGLHLHVWWPQKHDLPCPDIHDHPWDFASLMLTGSYRSELFEECNSGEPYYRYRFGILSEETGHQFVDVQDSRLDFRGSFLLPAGALSTFRRTACHRVTNHPGRFTASLVLTSKSFSRFSHVYRREYMALGDPARRVPLGMPHLKETILAVTDSL